MAELIGQGYGAAQGVVTQGWLVSGGGTTHTLSESGTLTSGGMAQRQTSKLLAAALSPVGSLARAVSRTFAAAVSPSGTLSQIKSKTLTLAATLTTVGSRALSVSLRRAASLSNVGGAARSLSRTLAASLSPTAVAAVSKAFLLSLEASLTDTASRSSQANLYRIGVYSPTVSAKRTTSKGLAGTLSQTGAFGVGRAFVRLLSASLGVGGALSRSVGLARTASDQLSTALVRATAKAEIASVTISGVSLAGRVRILILGAVLGFVGMLTNNASTKRVATIILWDVSPVTIIEWDVSPATIIEWEIEGIA